MAGVLAILLAVALAGCGEKPEPEIASTPLSLVQLSRSGSFLPAGDDQNLVLRGVGGGSLLSASGATSRTPISTAKLFARLERIAGPGPYDATVQGAEVNPIAYSLRVADPRFDGRTGTVRWRAEVTDGLPESVPASFGAASLTVDLGIEAAQLDGTVVSSGSGDPVAGAQVAVATDGLGLAAALTDAVGAFRLDALPGGLDYELTASKPGFERASVGREPSATDELRIEIEPVAAPGE